MSVEKDCPGLNCSGTELENGECEACPRGYYPNETSYCMPCTDKPSLYDWQYLGFMVCLPLVLNWIFVEILTVANGKGVWIQNMCALFEIATGIVLVLLVLPSADMLTLYVCTPKTPSDWKRLCPYASGIQQRYDEKLHCNQKADYPLYPLIVLIYGSTMLLTVAMRPLILKLLGFSSGMKAIYCALYISTLYPALLLTHTFAAGFIYCLYPYILIITAGYVTLFLFIFMVDQSTLTRLWSSIMKPKNLIILIASWLLLAYGIISLIGFQHLWFLSMLPLHTLIFYMFSLVREPFRIISDTEWVLDLD